MSIIIKQTYCQNLTVSSALVLVLFKILYCCNDKFMSNILLRDGYTTKYVIMNGIKKHKNLIYTNIAWGIARSPKLGILGSNLISDSYAAIFFGTGNHNKTEHEIFLFRTL
jgi:hypothetical protein